MPADVFLSGATGFVGRHLVDRAAARGLELISFDGDARDLDAAREAIAAARPRSVVHLASTRRPAIDPWAALADDLLMTGNLITAVRELAPEATMLVPGSAAQYGRGGDEPLSETDPTEPLTAYGEMKSLLEQACLSRSLTSGVRLVFTRSFNHVGPGQSPDAPVASWAQQLAHLEAKGGGALETGTLDVRRDFLDVRDVADAYLDLVHARASGVVNVCSGVGVSLRDVAAMLVALVRVPVSLEVDPELLRTVDPPAVVGDPGVLVRLTGFRPGVPLEQSLADALAEQRAAIAVGRVAVPGS